MTILHYNAQFMNTAPKIYICKSNTKRETVGHVKDFFNASLTIKFSALNMFTFSIPAELYINNVLQQNPLIDVIRERYLVRLELNGALEYFVIMKINKSMEADGFETLTYQCYSMGVQIANNLIRDYKETLNLSKHVNMMLAESNWKLGYVEVDFDMYDKEYEMASGNSLQCIFELCERFNAAVVFNTDKKTVNFHYPKNVGKNRGLRLKKGKYLENFNIDIDAEAMVTRLYPYGADGLDIRRLNSTGSNYIEDYSFYLYPFQHDDNWNVIRKSKYMPDDLCIAILKYQKKLEGLKGQFDSLVTQATAKREEVQKADQQMSVYKAQEADLLNQRDVINYTYKDDAPNHREWQDVIARLTTVQNNIAAQQIVLDRLKAELDAINAQLKALHDDVDVANPINFTGEQITEWKNFQHSKEYFNDSIINDEDLMKEALIVFDEFKQPPVSLNLSMEDFTKYVDFNLDYDKLNIGDLLTLTSKNLNISVTAKMTEIIINFEASTVNVTVANVESYNDDFDKFIASLGLSVSTSTQVSRDKWNWDKGREAYDEVTELLENAFDAAKQLIQGGLNGSVTLSERGLVSVDMREKSTWLMITNGQLLITPDDGNTVSVAINKDGVHAERLVGRLILGNKLIITDENGTFTINGNLLTITDLDGKVRVRLGEYKPGKYGLQLFSKDGNQVVLDEDGMLQTWQEGRTDNVDYSHPLELYLYIPKETISIRKVMLRFKRLQFRAYSSTTSGGGGMYTATDAGGGMYTSTDAGGGVYTSTESGGADILTSGDSGVDVIYGYSETELAAGHKHVFRDVIGHKHYIDLPDHDHAMNIPSHRHSMNIPAHNHNISIPDHTHDIEHGIFKGSMAGQISVYVNGTDVGGRWNGDRDDIDISKSMLKGYFNKIEIFSTQLGRIDATIFAQVMMGFE